MRFLDGQETLRTRACECQRQDLHRSAVGLWPEGQGGKRTEPGKPSCRLLIGKPGVPSPATIGFLQARRALGATASEAATKTLKTVASVAEPAAADRYPGDCGGNDVLVWTRGRVFPGGHGDAIGQVGGDGVESIAPSAEKFRLTCRLEQPDTVGDLFLGRQGDCSMVAGFGEGSQVPCRSAVLFRVGYPFTPPLTLVSSTREGSPFNFWCSEI
jgi:hypothetical protein